MIHYMKTCYGDHVLKLYVSRGHGSEIEANSGKFCHMSEIKIVSVIYNKKREQKSVVNPHPKPRDLG